MDSPDRSAAERDHVLPHQHLVQRLQSCTHIEEPDGGRLQLRVRGEAPHRPRHQHERPFLDSQLGVVGGRSIRDVAQHLAGVPLQQHISLFRSARKQSKTKHLSELSLEPKPCAPKTNQSSARGGTCWCTVDYGTAGKAWLVCSI